MPNDDLIRREDVKAKKVYCLERHEYVVPVAEIDWLPAAPQPMSAVEYERLCDKFFAWCNPQSCAPCRYRKSGCYYYNSSSTPEQRVAFIQKWAQEHPDKESEGGKEE